MLLFGQSGTEILFVQCIFVAQDSRVYRVV